MSRPTRDPHDRLVLVVVGGLLLLALCALAILGALALRSREPSDLLLGALIALLSNATGALGAVLTQTGRGSVQIDQPPEQPVPVEYAPDAGPL